MSGNDIPDWAYKSPEQLIDEGYVRERKPLPPLIRHRTSERLPHESGHYYTDIGKLFYRVPTRAWYTNLGTPDWWAEIPNEGGA